MSRLTIPKIPFRSLTMITPDYLSLPPIDIQGHVTQKQDCPLPQDSLTHTFSLDWGNLNHFGPKRPIQSNLTKILFFDQININHFDPKELVKTVHVVATYQVIIPYNQGS